MSGHVISRENARGLLTAILKGAGVSDSRAAIIADNLIEAELRGVSSHGMSRMTVYCQRIATGAIDPKAKLTVVSDRGSALALDAGHGPGQVMAREAMDRTIRRAMRRGVCVTAVRGGSHFGIAASYSMMALDYNMVGVSMTNAPPVMCPWGTRDAMLGTNPFSVAMPAWEEPDFVFDSATSVVARGKILLARQEGADIPEGWALDAEGRPTTNAEAALRGTVLPFGGYKGSGVALIVDLMCSLLSGASSTKGVEELYGAPDTPQNLGFMFMAIDIAAFTEPVEFRRRMDDVIRSIKSARKAPGVDEIYMPGDKERLNRQKLVETGIPVGPGVMGEILALAKRYAPRLDAVGMFMET